MRIQTARQQARRPLRPWPKRWAGRALVALLGLGVCLGGTLTLAEPGFQLRKKLPAHAPRQSVESAEQPIVLEGAFAATSEEADGEASPSASVPDALAQQASEEPATSVPDEVLKNAQPETAPLSAEPEGSDLEESADASTEGANASPLDTRPVIPGLPPRILNAQPLKPEKNVAGHLPETRRSAAKKSKKPHLTVQSPIPLLPEKSKTETAEAKLKPSTEQEPTLRTTPHTEKSSTSNQTIKASAQKTASPSKLTSASKRSKEKPLVHFPEPLAPAAQKTAEFSPTEKRTATYPRGYKALSPPFGKQQTTWRNQAKEAYELGNALGRENQLQGAIIAYKKALQLSPDFADAHVGLSTAYLLSGNWEDAMLSAKKALSLRGFMDSDNITRAYYNLSAIYCAADHFHKARQYYEKVQKAHHPLAPQLWNYLQQNCKP
jgi:hypothetical protein